MSGSLRKLTMSGAVKLRKAPFVHRPLKWARRKLWRAAVNGVWESARWLWGDHPSFGPPRDVVSIYQSLRTGDSGIRGRILVEDQGTPEADPESLLVTGGYNQHREQPWPIFWSEHADARLATESLALLLPPKTLCLESVYGYPRLQDDPVSRRFRLPKPVRLSGSWTSLISRWVPTESGSVGFSMPNYTHWMLDALPRLALLRELPDDFGIIVPADLHENQIECLSLLGLWERCRPTKERHLQVERYFFSSPTAMLQGYNPYGVDFLRREFIPRRDKTFVGPKRFLRTVGGN